MSKSTKSKPKSKLQNVMSIFSNNSRRRTEKAEEYEVVGGSHSKVQRINSNFETPRIEIPKVEIPKVEIPRVEIQKVETPRPKNPKNAKKVYLNVELFFFCIYF